MSDKYCVSKRTKAKSIILGYWDVVPMEAPNIRLSNAQSIGYSNVYVSQEKMTFSDGPNNRTQVHILSIHITPDGTIYLDDKGSVLTKWDTENGVIEVKNVLGFKLMWKRPGVPAPIANQPPAYAFGSTNPPNFI